MIQLATRGTYADPDIVVHMELENAATPSSSAQTPYSAGCLGEVVCRRRKRQEWAKHRRCDSEVRSLEDKPWRNDVMRSLEEGLPRLKVDRCERAARSYRATTGVGCAGFYPEAPLRLPKEILGRNCEVLRGGRPVWEMAATSLHDDVLPDSEERHERTHHGACSHPDGMVGVVACS